MTSAASRTHRVKLDVLSRSKLSLLVAFLVVSLALIILIGVSGPPSMDTQITNSKSGGRKWTWRVRVSPAIFNAYRPASTPADGANTALCACSVHMWWCFYGGALWASERAAMASGCVGWLKTGVLLYGGCVWLCRSRGSELLAVRQRRQPRGSISKTHSALLAAYVGWRGSVVVRGCGR